MSNLLAKLYQIVQLQHRPHAALRGCYQIDWSEGSILHPAELCI